MYGWVLQYRIIKAIHTYHPYLKEHKINPSTVSLEKYIRAVIGRVSILLQQYISNNVLMIVASYPDLDEDDSDEDPEVSTLYC